MLSKRDRIVTAWLEGAVQEGSPFNVALVRWKAIRLYKNCTYSEPGGEGMNGFHASKGWSGNCNEQIKLHDVEGTDESSSTG